jgi:hypothetical protein
MLASLALGRPAGAASNPLAAPVAALFTAFNADDRAKAVAMFAPAAPIVDEFAPYHFIGVGTWWDAYGADATANHETDGVITAQPVRVWAVTGTHGWIVVPTAYRYTKHGATGRQTGLLTFTLSRASGGWLFTSMTWSLLTDSPVK